MADRMACARRGGEAKVGARVLVFEGEQVSGSAECRMHEADGGVAVFRTAEDQEYLLELHEEMSEYSDDVPAEPSEATVIDSYSALLTSLGIATVQPTLTPDGAILATDDDCQRIERADRIRIPGLELPS